MHILLVNKAPIPVFAYGGTERVIWDLGKALSQLGHKISYLVPGNSTCPFANVIPIDPTRVLESQIPDSVDLVHFQFKPDRPDGIAKPWLMNRSCVHERAVALFDARRIARDYLLLYDSILGGQQLNIYEPKMLEAASDLEWV